jgi:hypothetical protein
VTPCWPKTWPRRRVKQLSDCNCPASHLVVKAKYAISQYRKRGSSVDGKLDTCFRAARRISSRFTLCRGVIGITPLRNYASWSLGRNLYPYSGFDKNALYIYRALMTRYTGCADTAIEVHNLRLSSHPNRFPDIPNQPSTQSLSPNRN